MSYSQEMHWRNAAQWAHYKFLEFLELEGDEQAHIVAHYEANNTIEAVISYETQHKSVRKHNRRQ